MVASVPDSHPASVTCSLSVHVLRAMKTACMGPRLDTGYMYIHVFHNYEKTSLAQFCLGMKPQQSTCMLSYSLVLTGIYTKP